MKSSVNLQFAKIIYQQHMTCNRNIFSLDNYFLLKSAGVRMFHGNKYFFCLLSRYSTRFFHAVMIWDLLFYWFYCLDPESPQTLPINKEHTLSFNLLITFTFLKTGSPNISSEEFLCSYWAYILSITCT